MSSWDMPGFGAGAAGGGDAGLVPRAGANSGTGGTVGWLVAPPEAPTSILLGKVIVVCDGLGGDVTATGGTLLGGMRGDGGAPLLRGDFGENSVLRVRAKKPAEAVPHHLHTLRCFAEEQHCDRARFI
jgi:hypothetical protein